MLNFCSGLCLKKTEILGKKKDFGEKKMRIFFEYFFFDFLNKKRRAFVGFNRLYLKRSTRG